MWCQMSRFSDISHNIHTRPDSQGRGLDWIKLSMDRCISFSLRRYRSGYWYSHAIISSFYSLKCLLRCYRPLILLVVYSIHDDAWRARDRRDTEMPESGTGGGSSVEPKSVDSILPQDECKTCDWPVMAYESRPENSPGDQRSPSSCVSRPFFPFNFPSCSFLCLLLHLASLPLS